MRRLYPHPYLSLTLFAVWLLLVNGYALGSLVFAAILATIIPLLTSAYWPNRMEVRNLPAIIGYILLVIWDIIVANVVVAKIVLFKPNSQLQPAWVTIPIDLRSPEAITLLAGTITLTPGTVTSDISACGRSLLVHCLHAPDPDAVRAEIKTRYEARLKRIFR